MAELVGPETCVRDKIIILQLHL